MPSPLFSVVTVTLNCAADAVKTAQSVLAQQAVAVEYVVKDGGSSDNTVQALTDLGIQVHVAPDKGVYSAMNQALAHCTGEYVVFINAGDTLAGPTVLADAAQRITAAGKPDLAYADVRSYVRHPELGKTGEPREIAYPARIDRRYLFWKMLCHQGWFMRREAYAQLQGFDEQYRLLADYDILLRLLQRPSTRTLHIPLVTAEFAADGASDRQRTQATAERKAIQARYYTPLERLLYGGIVSRLRSVARQVVYKAYPWLPANARRRIGGI